MNHLFLRKEKITIGRYGCDINIHQACISHIHAILYEDHVEWIQNSKLSLFHKISETPTDSGSYLKIHALELLLFDQYLIVKNSPFVEVNLPPFTPFAISLDGNLIEKPSLTIELEPPVQMTHFNERNILLNLGPSLTMCVVMAISSYFNHHLSGMIMPCALSISLLLFTLISRKMERQKVKQENEKKEASYKEYLLEMEKKIQMYQNELIHYYIHDQSELKVGIKDYEVEIQFRLPHFNYSKSELENLLIDFTKKKRIITHLPESTKIDSIHSIQVVGKYRTQWIYYCLSILLQKEISLEVDGVRCLEYLVEYEKKIKIIEEHADLIVEANELYFPYVNETDLLRRYGKRKVNRTFLEAMQINSIDEMKPIHLSTYEGLKALIGYNHQNQPIYLDLHQLGNGPHGLLAGMTGSGKSEFLITLILMLAFQYSSEYLSFFIIDFKGGGLSEIFKDRLPHLANCIDNLDPTELKRSIYGLQFELERRQRMFNEAKEILNVRKMDIDLYQRYYEKKELIEPLAHVVILVDEFAELKTSYPELIDEMIHIARIGRSLGFHLLLTTQKPSGVVNGQIWSNTNYHICMKVSDINDSMEIIHVKEGAYLKESGEFILQSGIEMLQGKALYLGNEYLPLKRVQFCSTIQPTYLAEYEVLLEKIQQENHFQAISLWQKSLDDPSLEIGETQIGMIDDYKHCKLLPIVINLHQKNLIIGSNGKEMMKRVNAIAKNAIVIEKEEDLLMIQDDEAVLLFENLIDLIRKDEYELQRFLSQSNHTIYAYIDHIQQIKYQILKLFHNQYIFDIEGYAKAMDLHIHLHNERNKGIIYLDDYYPFRIGEINENYN